MWNGAGEWESGERENGRFARFLVLPFSPLLSPLLRVFRLRLQAALRPLRLATGE